MKNFYNVLNIYLYYIIKSKIINYIPITLKNYLKNDNYNLILIDAKVYNAIQF